MPGLRRSKSAPRLIHLSIPITEVAHEVFRPWSPINPPFDRFTHMKDMDVSFYVISIYFQFFETLTIEDIKQFHSAIENKISVDHSTFTDILKGLSVKANDWQV